MAPAEFGKRTLAMIVTKAEELGSPLTEAQLASCTAVYCAEPVEGAPDIDQEMYDMTVGQMPADAAALEAMLGMMTMMAGMAAAQAAEPAVDDGAAAAAAADDEPAPTFPMAPAEFGKRTLDAVVKIAEKLGSPLTEAQLASCTAVYCAEPVEGAPDIDQEMYDMTMGQMPADSAALEAMLGMMTMMAGMAAVQAAEAGAADAPAAADGSSQPSDGLEFPLSKEQLADASFKSISGRATELGAPLTDEQSVALKAFFATAEQDEQPTKEEFDEKMNGMAAMPKEGLDGMLAMIAMMQPDDAAAAAAEPEASAEPSDEDKATCSHFSGIDRAVKIDELLRLLNVFKAYPNTRYPAKPEVVLVDKVVMAIRCVLLFSPSLPPSLPPSLFFSLPLPHSL
eukprot:COSAG01_NODE_3546_length_5949_cov_2.806700_3_plen_396_part_00